MPSFWTHYAFAADCEGLLWESPDDGKTLTAAIQAYPRLFYAGMQGPDLFLFYLPAAFRKRRLSTVLHTEQTAKLLCCLFAKAHALSGEDRLRALSYGSGFLGHYLLDSHTHAFVYAKAGIHRSADGFCIHNALESDLNRLAVKRSLGCDLSCLPAPDTYVLNKDDRRILCTLLSHGIERVYRLNCSPEKVARALWSVRISTRLLTDRSGSKARLTRLPEALLGRHYLSPLFLGESHFYEDPANLRHELWVDPFTQRSSHASFFDLYDRALAAYLPALRKLERLEVGSPKQRRDFFQTLCQRDFHGEPI